MQVALISTAESTAPPDLVAALGDRVAVRALPVLTATAGSESQALAEALLAYERMLLDERPDAVLVNGAGPAALAATLVAAKLELPIARLGAGDELASDPAPGAVPSSASSYGRLSDRLASVLLCAGEREHAALQRAGLAERAVVVGPDAEAVVAAIVAWLDEL